MTISCDVGTVSSPCCAPSACLAARQPTPSQLSQLRKEDWVESGRAAKTDPHELRWACRSAQAPSLQSACRQGQSTSRVKQARTLRFADSTRQTVSQQSTAREEQRSYCKQSNRSKGANAAQGAKVDRCVPPAPGMVPILISGCPNLAFSLATMMSHIIAISQPPPARSNAFELSTETQKRSEEITECDAIDSSDDRDFAARKDRPGLELVGHRHRHERDVFHLLDVRLLFQTIQMIAWFVEQAAYASGKRATSTRQNDAANIRAPAQNDWK